MALKNQLKVICHNIYANFTWLVMGNFSTHKAVNMWRPEGQTTFLFVFVISFLRMSLNNTDSALMKDFSSQKENTFHI